MINNYGFDLRSRRRASTISFDLDAKLLIKKGQKKAFLQVWGKCQKGVKRVSRCQRNVNSVALAMSIFGLKEWQKETCNLLDDLFVLVAQVKITFFQYRVTTALCSAD